ncbi:MAG: hypothetical protein PHI97_11200 [Desulfobulbus sp.]|nr:hypothetical protein [Desulfobulbus sp.]
MCSLSAPEETVGRSEKIGTGKFANNCVLYLRNGVGINLPKKNLSSFRSKLSIINSNIPIPGEVAVIKINRGSYAKIGHLAEVVFVDRNLNGATIRLREANFPSSGYFIRTIVAENIDNAEKNANIVGYYQPEQ